MQRRQKIPLLFIVFFFVVIIGLLTYARIWESMQEKVLLENATVLDVDPYRASGDLHWSFKGFRVFVDLDNRPIDFPEKYWNEQVKVGRRANLIVRESFFGEELDGLEIMPVE